MLVLFSMWKSYLSTCLARAPRSVFLLQGNVITEFNLIFSSLWTVFVIFKNLRDINEVLRHSFFSFMAIMRGTDGGKEWTRWKPVPVTES